MAYGCVAAEDRRIRVDYDIVFDIWMAFKPLHERTGRVLVEGKAAERDALVETDVASNNSSLADYNASSVVDEESVR